MSAWLVTGARGMLGRDVVAVLEAAGERVLPCTRAELDVTDGAAVAAALGTARPSVVVNCAAWTDVDGAEEAEPEAHRHNAEAPRLLARACARNGARLLHLSTDYVFPGTHRTPYAEDAPPGPRTAYGRTKLAGEQAVLAELPTAGAVVRTAWLYGRHGHNFVRTMAGRALAGGTVDVVDDQHGQPTWTRDVARHLLALGRADEPATGVHHSTSAGRTTWYEFAREVFQRCGAEPARVRPVSSAALARAAPRPAWSVLAQKHTPAPRRPASRDWREVLAEALPHIVPSGAQHLEGES
ncbi:dTDP-4-dehydrorhamnose reductase [Streptomyces xiaopingdaonensis]|uniref:dTDP-4-dehydrorhamnose reductase n=1 Tax=Streptomyces xiaopingdaonensis TaxID=1565415 RepID=UPI00036B2B77|nr:dTDP-4-dehydrorhamnose reductase [Streptomyces xiaopingdaonensis]